MLDKPGRWRVMPFLFGLTLPSGRLRGLSLGLRWLHTIVFSLKSIAIGAECEHPAASLRQAKASMGLESCSSGQAVCGKGDDGHIKGQSRRGLP